MTRAFAVGERVTLRPDRAEAYNLPRKATYTVARTFPHKCYARTWVVLAELEAVAEDGSRLGVVDSRELRTAGAR